MIYGKIEPPNMNNGTTLDLLQINYMLIQYMVLLNGNINMYNNWRPLGLNTTGTNTRRRKLDVQNLINYYTFIEYYSYVK